MGKNLLYYGDNLDVLRRHIRDESVDLVYLDPPFNSNKNYNVLFKEQDGKRSSAQIRAFNDTWTWDESAAASYEETVRAGGSVADALQAMYSFLSTSNMMSYLSMLAPRLVELRRVLKSTGSIYLHCDPTASHYIKILMDAVFGVKNFRNEIVWNYKRWTAGDRKFQRMHDVILFYSKTEEYHFNKQYQPFSEKTSIAKYKRKVEDGRAVQDKENLMERDPEKGVSMSDVWDISFLHPMAKERLGYPTQKPEELLDRIIKASSNPGDTILDPFAGCYDDKTEVLTKEGFKLFKDVTQSTRIATLNPNTKDIEYRIPLAIQQYDYEGKMLHMTSRGIDLCVTPDHKMFVQSRKTWDPATKAFVLHYTDDAFKRADEVRRRDKVYRSSKWVGKQESHFVLEDNRRFVMDKWLRFLGFWIGDGWYTSKARHNRVGIKQHTYKQMVRDIMTGIDVDWHESNGQFHFSDRQIHKHLSLLGKTLNRHVPSYVKDLPPEQIRIFLDGFAAADGWTTAWGNRYCTASRRLADDLQELLLKIGRPANVYPRKPRTKVHYSSDGRPFWSKSVLYTLYEYNTEYTTVRKIESKAYKGRVYCVTVPNHIILVRRNGKSQWCGNCGTATASAQRLERQWIGIDITYLATNLIKHRLQDAFGPEVKDTYQVIGEPTDLAGAGQLAVDDRYQFQWWSLGLVGARPAEGKKGADHGIDGKLYFFDEAHQKKAKQILFSVKSGHVKVGDIRDLRGVIEREKAAIGVFITLEAPTGPMKREAASAGFYESPGWGEKYPRIQILTVEDLLAGHDIKRPPINITFKKAPKVQSGTEQGDLWEQD